VDNAPDNYSRRPDTAAFAAKEREQIGSDIFGAAAPAQSARQQHAQQQYAEDQYGNDITYEEVHAPSHVEATEVDVKAMTHGDLRMLCRDHGLSPAGGKETLVERLVDAMHAGQIKVIVPNKGASGVSSVGNNYGRADGQNVGNFMTGRSSSRVLAPPGGGSSFSFGNDGSENAQRGSGGGGNAQHSVGTRFF
jgi:SPIRAL1-like protein